MRVVAMNEYTCNGCGKVYLVYSEDEPPCGYHLNVSHIHGTGGDFGSVYACSEKCIKKAVLSYRDSEQCGFGGF